MTVPAKIVSLFNTDDKVRMRMERPWEGKTIIVVDDSLVQRGELRRYFTELGLEVVGEAENGLKALELIASSRPDLVSLDIIMPVMDGMECYEKIEAMDGEKPLVFFITALAAEHRVTECYAETIGLDRFIPKPVTIPELEQRLRLLWEAKNPLKPV